MATERVLNGRYKLVEKIGDGGMATVFLATDLLLDREVAVKILRDQYAADSRFLERFRREARAAANLCHPNIVSIFDVGQDGDTHYIVMERIEGVSLREVLDREAPLSAARAVRLAVQVCSALDYAHSKGLVHRDIKPQNILLVRGEQVKVVDFGIAKGVADASLTDAGVAMGTVHYLSPEQARGEASTPLSDLYSLGVVLYEMTCGRLPFESDTAIGIALKHIEEAPERPSAVCAAIPPGLEEIILRSMAKDPADRFQSAAEFAVALGDYQRFGSDQTVAVPVARPAARQTQATRTAPATRTATVPKQRTVQPIHAGPAPAGTRVVAKKTRSTGLGCTGGVIAAAIIGLLVLLVPFFVWIMPAMSEGRDPFGFLGLNQGTATPTPTTEPTSTASLVRVPNVIGKPVDQAQNELSQAGLNPVVAATEYSDTVAENTVIDQSVAEGQEVESGFTIELTVSQGKQVVHIPPLVNVTQADAAATLDDLGVRYNVREEPSATVAAGVVIRQSHEGEVPVGTEVTLVVSVGDKVKVPDVFSMREAEARAALQAAGLKTGEPNYQTQADMPDGVDINIVPVGAVLSASPDFNTWVDRGTTVHLAVRAPEKPSNGNSGSLTWEVPNVELPKDLDKVKDKLKGQLEKAIGNQGNQGD